MDTRCLLGLGPEVYGLEVETLGSRRFHGGSPQPHVHPSYHLILVAAGACSVHVPGRAVAEAGSGSLIIIDPLVPHGFVAAPGRGCEHVSLIWRFRSRSGAYALAPLRRLGCGDASAAPGVAIERLARADALAFVRTQREAEAALAAGDAFTASMRAFELFFVGLDHLRRSAGPAPPSDRRAALAERVRAIIARDIADPGLGVARIAREIGLRPGHLNASFVAREGMPISQYLLLRRVELVKAMLAEPGGSVAAAAALAGFSRPGYCARVFRRLVGMSPTAWRDRGLRG